MIEIENVETYGWESAIRGMRNPMNSWDKSDSFGCDTCKNNFPRHDVTMREECGGCCSWNNKYIPKDDTMFIGQKDHELMTKLRNAGTDHRKFMRMITVYTDITAPLYWWKEFDTYKVGTVANSCSTMHKIADKEFELDDFSCEHLIGCAKEYFNDGHIYWLNYYRDLYINGGVERATGKLYKPKDKDIWWQMIQLLPSSYNQKRTVMLNYEVLANMYHSRKNHKLDEWRDFCKWIEELPYSELIIGED